MRAHVPASSMAANTYQPSLTEMWKEEQGDWHVHVVCTAVQSCDGARGDGQETHDRKLEASTFYVPSLWHQFKKTINLPLADVELQTTEMLTQSTSLNNTSARPPSHNLNLRLHRQSRVLGYLRTRSSEPHALNAKFCFLFDTMHSSVGVRGPCAILCIR
jgi:hypothetical protein